MQSTSDESVTKPLPATATSTTLVISRRDIQRMALRDLVALATECANTETELERRLQTALDQSQKELQTRSWDIDDRLRTLKEKIGVEYKQRLAESEAEDHSQIRQARAADDKLRAAAEFDLKNVQRDLQKSLDHARWLAESVFDAATIQLREEMKVANAALSTRTGQLDELQTRSVAAMALFGQVPAPEVPPPPEQPTPADPLAAYAGALQQAQTALAHLSDLPLPRLFIGGRPIVYTIFIVIAFAGLAQLLSGGVSQFRPWPVLITFGATLAACIVAGIILSFAGIKQVKEAWIPVCHLFEHARRFSAAEFQRIEELNKKKYNEAAEKRQSEEKTAADSHNPRLTAARQKRDAAVEALRDETDRRLEQLQTAHKQNRQNIEKWHQDSLADLQERYAHDLRAIRERFEKRQAEARQEYDNAFAALELRLAEGIQRIQAPIEEKSDQAVLPWNDPAWDHWTPPKTFASTITLGQLVVDLRKIADAIPRKSDLKLKLPDPFIVTASLGFPRQASLLVQTDRSGREEGLRIIQMVMARLLTTLPAGRARFTIIDPVGLGQNFAGFMHLADHDEALVGGRIWTETDQIQQRLADLTEHMETVIQKYLRNEYETIDEYNDQAGELAEPYRFLVIADFPTSCEVEACKRLSAIAASGARCGVYTLVLQDKRQSLPDEMRLEELESHSVVLACQDGKYAWKDEVFGQFPLTIDPPPSEEWLTRAMDIVGRHAKEAKRVEVNFDTIAPEPAEFWTQNCNSELAVPIGRMGATRLQHLKLGRGVAQHVLIAGKTGSGKSTLLHAIITNLAMWFRPDEVEFYLVDFKKGVEFKTYATHALPHARAIAVESDREFGLSVLHRLDAELTGRGNLFRNAQVQDITAYRAQTGQILPRILLIIDEYQEFFTEDDKLGQDASLLIDRLVRQGRAFGVHVILGSQTIGGSAGLSRATLGQMAIRIALQTSDADSQLILGDGNAAARLLTRPGEAIYNDAGGLVENNSPFQVAWLPDERKEVYLDAVSELTRTRGLQYDEPIVFEGNVPADIRKNKRLAEFINGPLSRYSGGGQGGGAPAAWIGDPVAIKDPSAVVFRRQSGVNALLIGQQDEQAVAIIITMILSLNSQHTPDSATIHILDGNPADSPLFGIIHRYASALPIPAHNVDYRGVDRLISDLAAELDRRRIDDSASLHSHPAIYVFIAGLQRYRMLRKGEEDFSFSASDEEKKPEPSKQFAELLRDGPALGIHFVVWVDTPASFERTMDRGALREFDNRILFQMSANDSSNLIDSPAANKLGFHRALSYSEEQGVLEKFRPYALPDEEWFRGVAEALRKRGRQG
jgi:DNA segregation ATPase FtsK/SpoIIIE, S-DNA-T family